MCEAAVQQHFPDSNQICWIPTEMTLEKMRSYDCTSTSKENIQCRNTYTSLAQALLCDPPLAEEAMLQKGRSARVHQKTANKNGPAK